MKRVYLDDRALPHPLYKELVEYPPPGYEFIVKHTTWNKGLNSAFKVGFIRWFEQRILSELIPVNLFIAQLERFKKIPQGTDLTYAAAQQLIFRKEPWVVDVEHVLQFSGYKIRHLKRYKRLIEKTLTSDYCKKIMLWSEWGRKTVISNLDCSGFEHKMEVVPFAVHAKDFTKAYGSDRVKLLFVGSSFILGQFDQKGGKEVVDAFIQLKEKYDNLELVIRSDCPRQTKKKCQQISGVRIIDSVISQELMEQEFKSADILLYPTHFVGGKVVLEAMSYEMPVIIMDTSNNPEMVEDGKTGFILKRSERVPYEVESHLPAIDTPAYKTAIKTTDPKVVQELVEKTSILIENEELRRRMGRAAREEVETGKHSIQRRNEKLKRIFDEATEGSKGGDLP